MQVFGVDVGGSGVKGAPVDLSTGELSGGRTRIPTPKPATPDAVADAIVEIVETHEWSGPIGVTVPSVVINGVVQTAANIDPGWIRCDVATLLTDRRHDGR